MFTKISVLRNNPNETYTVSFVTPKSSPTNHNYIRRDTFVRFNIRSYDLLHVSPILTANTNIHTVLKLITRKHYTGWWRGWYYEKYCLFFLRLAYSSSVKSCLSDFVVWWFRNWIDTKTCSLKRSLDFIMLVTRKFKYYLCSTTTVFLRKTLSFFN